MSNVIPRLLFFVVVCLLKDRAGAEGSFRCYTIS